MNSIFKPVVGVNMVIRSQ